MGAITAETIARLESMGGRRWIKGSHDRIYFNPQSYGVKFEYYGTGNIRNCEAFGGRVSNSEGYRFKATKAFIDLSTGEISVETATYHRDDIRAAIANMLAEATA